MSDLESFRTETRAWLEENCPPLMRTPMGEDDAPWGGRKAHMLPEAKVWLDRMGQKGWTAPTWPTEYGGGGLTPEEARVLGQELGRIHARPALMSFGVWMLGPVLLEYATEEQKRRFLPGIVRGETRWCQGYSEPGAGSDLASLQCRAVRDGDDFVIDGTKIWTTHAHAANWMFLLVRTQTSGKPQAGITFLLVEMATAGIAVQPIVTLSGEHEVNQVFFDGVRVPASQRVGAENDGWTVAKYLLEFERGGGSYAARLAGAMRQVRAMAKAEAGGDGSALWRDGDFRRRAADLEVAIGAVEFTERRVVSAASTGKPVGSAISSMLKLKGSETMQLVTELAMEVLGVMAAPDQRFALGMGANEGPIGPAHAATPTARYLNTRAASIYGGSSEVQRNILARAALGL